MDAGAWDACNRQATLGTSRPSLSGSIPRQRGTEDYSSQHATPSSAGPGRGLCAELPGN